MRISSVIGVSHQGGSGDGASFEMSYGSDPAKIVAAERTIITIADAAKRSNFIFTRRFYNHLAAKIPRKLISH
jgi:hypothetical protein